MFQASRTLFLYALSPIHMGAGTAVDVIDNPVQREVHTSHPLLAGSGLKGAFRNALRVQDVARARIEVLFGPETTNADAHAGAISISDGQLLLFPVRAMAHGFVYATSATALARAARLLSAADPPFGNLQGPEPGQVMTTSSLANETEPLVLEALALDRQSKQALDDTAAWLAARALPEGDGHAFFRDKLRNHLVVLSEADFGHFLRTGMVVEPHVRINDDTGTADEGGLFFTENVPPESVFVTCAMATPSRRRDDDSTAEALLSEALGSDNAPGLLGRRLQIGGDATTGRGHVILTAAEA